MHYDMRPDRVGWTVFDVTTDCPVVLDNHVVLVGLDLDSAHELVTLLHRTITPSTTASRAVRPARVPKTPPDHPVYDSLKRQTA